MEEENWLICNKNESYTVAIPTKMNWNEARKVCGKLGGGNITEPKNKRDISHAISLFKNMKSLCDFVWTPLYDEDVEGQFKSIVTGQLASFLPWNANRPDGADEENHVAFHLTSQKYDDNDKMDKHCVTCDLYKSTEFVMQGVCKDTHFGRLLLFCK